MSKPLAVSGLNAYKMVSLLGYKAYNVYHPSGFTVDDNMRLRNTSIWILKYVMYYRKCKSIARRIVQLNEGLIVSDEDFASISVGNEMKRKRIFITDIVRTSFIKTPLLSLF